MHYRLFLFGLLLVAVGEASAQPATQAAARSAALQPARIAELVPVPNILRNDVTNLHAEGDSLWAGPFLNLTTDGGATWQLATADSLQGTRNRVFSLDVEGQTLWAGLGYTARTRDGSFPSAGGFLFSGDGGRTFQYRFPPLDAPGDTVVTYGVSRLSALAVIVPEQSPPYDIDYDPLTGDVWVAAWASGIRRSRDNGLTWERVVLPPDNLDEIDPDLAYNFRIEPFRGSSGNQNHSGFSVLVDETGTVWAGTAGGVNRSLDGGLSWQRFTYDGSPGGLTGNWVIAIEEQPAPNRNPIWMATWSAAEGGSYGVTVTRDGGETFEQLLLGETVTDFAFQDRAIYAAGRESGLFVSEDDGLTWRTVRDFFDPRQPDRIVRPTLDVVAVAATPTAVWVGTSDGLFKSTDRGRTWALFRAEVPLRPETPTPEVPAVETYAYPNPFSASNDQFVRIRYELGQPRQVEVQIFDFGMNLVRQLVDQNQPQGTREVIWDGTDDRGLRVANGPYFYAVRVGGETVWGKILVLE